jgi:hypothetical protein
MFFGDATSSVITQNLHGTMADIVRISLSVGLFVSCLVFFTIASSSL